MVGAKRHAPSPAPERDRTAKAGSRARKCRHTSADASGSTKVSLRSTDAPYEQAPAIIEKLQSRRLQQYRIRHRGEPRVPGSPNGAFGPVDLFINAHNGAFGPVDLAVRFMRLDRDGAYLPTVFGAGWGPVAAAAPVPVPGLRC